MESLDHTVDPTQLTEILRRSFQNQRRISSPLNSSPISDFSLSNLSNLGHLFPDSGSSSVSDSCLLFPDPSSKPSVPSSSHLCIDSIIMDAKTLGIAKLDGKNYSRWMKGMQIILMGQGLWQVVTQDPPNQASAEASEVWSSNSTKAFSIIFIHCETEQQDLVIDCVSAKQAWDTLREQYLNSSLSTINRLLDRFNNQRMTRDQSASQFINSVKSIANDLKSTGEPISDKVLFNKLIRGLPSTFDQLKCTLNVQMGSLTLSTLT